MRSGTRLGSTAAGCLARTVGALTAAFLLMSVAVDSAQAADSWEGWPEAWAFVRLNPQTRLFFDVAYTTGKEAPAQALDLAAYVDVAIKPILRPVLRQEDWARNRYLWARVGYDHILKAEDGVRAPSEDRGIVALYAKNEMPAAIWLEGRARADLRWIDDDYSTRYRLRLEATREFSVLDRPVTPYLNAEWFYDTRFDGWARVLYQGGAEVTFSKGFRFELYLARQEDDLPAESALNALGAVAKFYF